MNNTKKKFKFPISGNQLIILGAIVLVFILFTVLNKNYFSWTNIINILVAATLTGSIAIGHTFLIISGENDLGPGSYAGFSGVLLGVLLDKGFHPLVAIAIIIGIAICIGCFNSFNINVIGLTAFIGTFISQSIFRGLAFIICHGKSMRIVHPILTAIGKARAFNAIPWNVIVLLILFVIFGFILAKTRFGRSIYAIGGNREAARLAGLNGKKIKTILFIMVAILSSLGGVVLACRMNVGAPAACMGSEFDSITAVIIGGTSFAGGVGNMIGSFLGMILIQSFNTGLTMVQIDTYWQYVARGVLLLLALSMDRYTTKKRERDMLRESMKVM